MNKYINIFIIIILGLTIYSNVLNGEFVSDDYAYIVNNAAIRHITNISDMWGFFPTRFLVIFSFALDYKIHGLDLFGYHLVNVAVHIVNTLLVYYLILLTFQTPALKDKKQIFPVGSTAFYAALIFLCHPVQTQAVSFISQRSTVFVAMFYLCSVICYVKSRMGIGRKAIWFGLAAVIAGSLSKETMLTLPLALVFYDKFFLEEEAAGQLIKFKKKHAVFLIPVIIPLIFLSENIGAAYGLKKQIILGHGFSPRYGLMIFHAWINYLKMFFLPVGLARYHDFTIVKGIFDLRTVTAMAVFAALVFLIVSLYKKHRLISFGLSWFFIASSVELISAAFIKRGILFDHWMYLPMFGLVIVFVRVVSLIAKDEHGFRGLLMTAVIILTCLTCFRNNVWRTEIGLWSDAVGKSPNNPLGNYYLGKAYDRQGRIGYAKKYYQRAVDRDPDLVPALNDLGFIYMDEGSNGKALKTFEKILSLNPGLAFVYNNIAYLHFTDKEYKRAIEFYGKSLQRQKEYPDAYFYMGQSYLNLRNYGEAVKNFRRAELLYKSAGDSGAVKKIQEFLEKIPAGR